MAVPVIRSRSVSPACSRFCDSVLPPPSQDSQHENDIVVKKNVHGWGFAWRCVSVRCGSRALGDHPECACTDAAVTERPPTHMMRREGAWSIFTMRAGPRPGPGPNSRPSFRCSRHNTGPAPRQSRRCNRVRTAPSSPPSPRRGPVDPPSSGPDQSY